MALDVANCQGLRGLSCCLQLRIVRSKGQRMGLIQQRLAWEMFALRYAKQTEQQTEIALRTARSNTRHGVLAGLVLVLAEHCQTALGTMWLRLHFA